MRQMLSGLLILHRNVFRKTWLLLTVRYLTCSAARNNDARYNARDYGIRAGRLIAAGEKRQREAIIFDVGMSALYKMFPSARREHEGA